MTRIGLFTPASPIEAVALKSGVAKIESAGLSVKIHNQALSEDFIYAGDDATRVGALWDLAIDDEIDVLWCSRGGYGCSRMLPLLDELTAKHGPPPRKLLVGYSDVTVLHHYAQTRWAWPTLHANMPATSSMETMPDDQFQATVKLVQGEWHDVVGPLFGLEPMRFFGSAPTKPVTAPLLGGNLATWNYLTGTPYQPGDLARKFLFFEDIGEGFHKIDGYFTQLSQAGGLDGIAGLILGGFHDCLDSSSKAKSAQGGYTEEESLEGITTQLGQRHGFPVAWKLPVTHGPDYWPLPLNADYRLDPDGRLTLTKWDWLSG